MDASVNLKWVGPDDKVTNMSGLYDALVEALRAAPSEGEEEARAEERQQNPHTLVMNRTRQSYGS